jgi:carboxyl-terminal processing protease
MRIVTLLILFTVSSAQAKTFDKKLFDHTVNAIKENSYYELSDHEIYQSALAGILKHMESKNRVLKKKDGFMEDANVILPPRNVKEMNKEMAGEISGIGVGIKYDKDKGHIYPKLVEVLKEGGAASAGLKVGDQILKIDGTPINKFKSFRDIVYKIRGKSGTKVKLGILRDGETLTRKVKRKKIAWDAVKVGEKDKSHSVIKVNFFNKKTASTLNKELKDMKKRGAKSLILDLRNNTGGLFEEGLSTIRLFASKGDTILQAKYNKGVIKKYKADVDGIGKDLKVVVLINKGTKSMGEAFTSSLKQLRSATIIGEKSYGKGTMETVLKLENDHSVKFTVGRLFTSDDKTWDRSGIMPDVEVPYVKSESKRDAQLELAKLLLVKN